MLLLAATGEAMARVAVLRSGLAALMLADFFLDIDGPFRLMHDTPTRLLVALQSIVGMLRTARMFAGVVPDIDGSFRLMHDTPTRP